MHLTSKWQSGGDSFSRTIVLEADDGEVIESFGEHPTLDDLRELQRTHGIRLDLRDKGIPCANCGDEIDDRFGADPDGNILCWDCAMAADSQEYADVQVNTDPAKATISESKLYEKSLCDYVINVATGCRHGCKFCYVPTTPGVESREDTLDDRADVDDPQRDWGSYLLYRDDLPERLRDELDKRDLDDWQRTDRGRGIVMLSSGTDCYQDRRAAQITRACVRELVERDIPVRILTRSPAVLRDKDLYAEHSDLVSVGSSISSFDTSLVKAMEPNAPPPMARWEALNELQRAGVPVYVSMSPTYPTMGEKEIWETLTWLRALNPDVVFHEPMNPRGANFQMCLEAAQEVGYDDLVAELERIQDRECWVEYALEQINLVQELSQKFKDFQIHSWPDRELIKATGGRLRNRLRAMRQTISPEHFSNSSSSRTDQAVFEGDPELRRECSREDTPN